VGSFRRVFCALVLFGISFGYVEAAVVVYLRSLYAPLHVQYQPGETSSDLFPLIRLEQLEAAGSEPMHWLSTELIRELATLVMLAAVGWIGARNVRQWFAGFLIGFGVWDISFYVFLKLLIDWPDSFLTWDLLFLLPVPWAGPVLAPLVVAASMLVAGSMILHGEYRGRPMLLHWPQWLALGIGGTIIVVAFCWDHRNLLDGGRPNPFNWPLFILGMTIGIAGFLFALPSSAVRVAAARRSC
jgi:hypothetical protein